ncbi:putative ABC transporter permease [Actinomyces sp. B33]|uniref:putative ABC transporter permease n=1 Tax=Actinomyces sp. B33 TaxID=2942131 RepID=UPI0023413527|nr:putative ABC transporter permease [Actinomyces sp. B33]MDC4233750.1 putative ABC transporter permease [Actinomyces sp. B33]
MNSARSRSRRRTGSRYVRAGRWALRAFFVVSALLAGLRLTLALVEAAASGAGLLEGIRIAVLAAIALGAIAMIVFDFSTRLPQARWTARALFVAIIAGVVVDTVHEGFSALHLIAVFQILSLVSFQTVTDERLRRNERFSAPWERPSDLGRRDYIPLNFFNGFWVFAVASVLGLVVEVVWRLLTVGEYQDRAGMLWGPFSPIYGFGALLMTIALNRWWNHSKIVIFLVAGVIGAAFEYAVSWWMGSAFGIVAWDYSGTFLNVDGRTNAGFFCAWGLLGLVWIRLLLPDVLRAVDAIPLTWRAVVTTTAALAMLVNGAMTLMAIDRWYARQAGEAPAGPVEEWVDRTWDDAFMEHRFQTMTLDARLSTR